MLFEGIVPVFTQAPPSVRPRSIIATDLLVGRRDGSFLSAGS